MPRTLTVALACLLIVLPTTAFGAQEVWNVGARVHSLSGQSLTGASHQAPGAIVTDFLRSHQHPQRTLDSIVQVREFRLENKGLTLLRYEQEVAGLKVFGAYAKAAINTRGELVHLIDGLVTPSAEGVVPASVNAREALQAALSHLHPQRMKRLAEEASYGNTVEFARAGDFYSNPAVTRVAIPLSNGALHEGFLVETWTASGNLLHHTLVSGAGAILGVELRTNTDSYRIFPDHPGNSSQTVVSGPGAGNAESPAGWLAGSQTTFNVRGNNVSAYLDTDANNGPDAGGSTVTSGDFLATANLSQDPSTNTNKEVAVQNLFYFNNVIHDKLYSHGFVESTGNFQNDNFGNGGNGNDAVNAEAQDGAGTNNANFSTPNDGSPGRMQMFLWTATNPRRDGDLDSDIIYHEYCHGLTWRMIGSMGGAMSGAIGEGMSDVCAILMNDDDRVGEYSTDDPDGIRSARYTNYGRTYGDFGGSSVHFDGEIYAATIWDLWKRFEQAGISQNTLWDYIIGGMNFTPSGPSMDEMRDGILQAASGSGDECLIWETFADHGIGAGASASVKGGGPFGGNVTINESFDLPVECGGNPGGGCTLLPVGASCNSDSECCSGKCKGPSGGKTCK